MSDDIIVFFGHDIAHLLCRSCKRAMLAEFVLDRKDQETMMRIAEPTDEWRLVSADGKVSPTYETKVQALEVAR